MDEKENKTEDWVTKYNRDRLDTANWKEKMYNETVDMLKTKERFINYFKQFHPASVDSFIAHYAQRKVTWDESGEGMKNYNFNVNNKYNLVAEWALIGCLHYKIEKIRLQYEQGLLAKDGVIGFDF